MTFYIYIDISHFGIEIFSLYTDYTMNATGIERVSATW